ncbi:MAG: DUF1049 domain-containing protein [Chitinivibrionales bacterium]|nr:DUF1049 domain-containing protein [Chitinivibrionales bacterium]
MKFFKWALFFTASFLIAWIVIFTFIQEPFKQQVSAKIFSYNSPAIPVYLYVAGALGLGLLIGILMSVYYNIALRAEIHKRDKIIKRLEKELESRQEPEKITTHALPQPEPVSDPDPAPHSEHSPEPEKTPQTSSSETERFLDRDDTHS